MRQSNLRNRIKGKSSGRDISRIIPIFLLLSYFVSLLIYLILLAYARLPSPILLIASLGSSQYGVQLGPVSLGYLSIALMLSLGVLSFLAKPRDGFIFSRSAIIMAFIIGVLLGSTYAAASMSIPLHSVQDVEQGFTLTVYYSSTTLTLGQNLSVEYVLADNSYTLTAPYYFFGGQFSMVFNDSTGKQVVAFRAPISFSREEGQYLVELKPGESWKTVLGWNGTIFSSDGGKQTASPGNYTLMSYAVLQDANASLYVELHPSDISIIIRN